MGKYMRLFHLWKNTTMQNPGGNCVVVFNLLFPIANQQKHVKYLPMH